MFTWKVFRIGTVRYNWPMSAHASQADSEDLPFTFSHMVNQSYNWRLGCAWPWL